MLKKGKRKNQFSFQLSRDWIYLIQQHIAAINVHNTMLYKTKTTQLKQKSR